MNMRVPQLRFEPADELAALCKAGGDPLRLNVLRALANDSFGVLELAQIFAIGQSGMSHHLKVLAQAGIAPAARAEELAPEAWPALLRALPPPAARGG